METLQEQIAAPASEEQVVLNAVASEETVAIAAARKAARLAQFKNLTQFVTQPKTGIQRNPNFA